MFKQSITENLKEESLFMEQSNKSLAIPKVERSRIVIDAFIKVRCDSLVLENQHRFDYYSLITRTSAVCVLAVTPEGLFVLTEEYRHPTGKVLLSCAGGYLDPEEDPIAAAQRELREETGYDAREYKLLGNAYPYPGISNQTIYYVAALDATKQSEPQPEMSETVRPKLFSAEELNQAIVNNHPIDGNLCTALFFFKMDGNGQ